MRYAIWVENKEQHGFLELHSDGVIKLCEDVFDAKLMPSKEHAIQLAKSVLKFEDYTWVEISKVMYDIDTTSLLWDGERELHES